MNAITRWWQMLHWSTAALIVAIAISVVCIAFLTVDGYRHRRRFNRRVDRTRIAAGDLDESIVTGQFYTPSAMTDKKGIRRC